MTHLLTPSELRDTVSFLNRCKPLPYHVKSALKKFERLLSPNEQCPACCDHEPLLHDDSGHCVFCGGSGWIPSDCLLHIDITDIEAEASRPCLALKARTGGAQ